MAVRLVLLALTALTVLGFLTFNYKNIDFGGAIASTLPNAKTVFVLPRLAHDTAMGLLYQLLVIFCLGILSTLFGAVIAFLCALLCAEPCTHTAFVGVSGRVSLRAPVRAEHRKPQGRRSCQGHHGVHPRGADDSVGILQV